MEQGGRGVRWNDGAGEQKYPPVKGKINLWEPNSQLVNEEMEERKWKYVHQTATVRNGVNVC